jgi:hypothetical protein
MKAIIYAGIALFSVASVYGVADYYNSRKSGELKKLYVEEKLPTPSPVVDEKTVEIIPVNNTETTTTETKVIKAKAPKKVKKVEKRLRFENFSRARIPEPVIADSIVPVVKKQN